MTTNPKARRRAFGFVSLVAAVGLAFTTLVGGEAGAISSTRHLSGTLDFKVGASPGCPDPATCIVTFFRGDIRGPGEGPATAVFPAQPPTNLIGEGLLVVHTTHGDLNLAGTTVFNPDPASDGEIVFLFEITGGTGMYTGATGYITATGTSDIPGSVVTKAEYTGKLILP